MGKGWVAAFGALALLSFARTSAAVPEAHILRIDPRAGVLGGQPVLTTLVEVVQFNSLASALEPCASVTGFNATLDCQSAALEKPGAVWSPFPFPKANAHLLVEVDGSDTLAEIDGDPKRWGESQKDPNIGTAWLVTLDASSGMGNRYGEARAVAREFIEAMQPNDLMDLMIFDDRAVIHNSKWKTFPERNQLVKVLNDQPSPAPSHGRDRPLFNELKGMTVDGFSTLGNTQGPQAIPMHQAMVVLSNGSGRNDASSAAPSAEVYHQFVTKGRFPDDNTSSPKTPLPLIAVWFPSQGGLANDVFRNNDEQFMQSLANPEIGGLFDIVREGQGEAKGKTIIGLVKARFNAMYVVKWKLACLRSKVEQTFNLEFVNTVPVIKGDASFKDVPIGVDPSQWPLDVDMARTKADAEASPLYPGGSFKVYGNFCWGGDKTRAAAYFVPAGTKPDPNANSTDPALAKRAMQQLVQQNMRGSAKEVDATFATFEIPDTDQMLEGNGDSTIARLVIVDSKANRASGHDEKSILTLKAKKSPFNYVLILGIVGGVVVLGLLVIVATRGGGGGGGGGGRKRGQTPPPAPVVAGGSGYGPPPGGGYGGAPPAGGYGSPPGGGGGGGYGASPPGGAGGGYGASPAVGADAFASTSPVAGGAGFAGTPAGGLGAYAPSPASPASPGAPVAATPGGTPAVVQVRCPACQMTTMATPGQPSVCFSCGQPLPASVTGAVSGAPLFPLTGAIGAAPLAPPPDPYGRTPQPLRALIIGTVGQFPIAPGSEVRVGRDAAQCAVALTEPRVSGVHSTLKFEAARLWVRDEQSNNGTFVAGERISPNTWVAVPPGRPLRFGPVEFDVRFET